jgi:hypothetical protein
VGEQEIGWDMFSGRAGDEMGQGRGTELVEDCICLCGRGNVNHQIWTGCFVRRESHKQEIRVC